MATIMWAKSAVGTNLGFVRDFGRILKSWREILQTTLQKKQVPVKQKTRQVELLGREAKVKCLYHINPTFSPTKRSLQSRIFHSVFSRTINRTVASQLRRQAALRFSLNSGGGLRRMPIMSLVGVTLGVNLTSILDDGSSQMMSELQESFRSYTWQIEPLEKLPTCLDDLLINEKSIANGCEGAVYKAKVKTEAVTSNDIESPVHPVADVDDTEFNLAVKAVFNYGAESNAQSICNELQREIVPLRPNGCSLDALLGERVGRLPPHPNIVDMPGIFVDDMLVTEEGLKKFPAAMPHRLNPEQFYGRNKTLYLVMRRRNSHLRDFLLNSASVTMTTRCQILAQLLEGVAHLGDNGVAHRDLKADNILVDVPTDGGCPRVEICDFGCCLAEEDKSLKVPFPTRDMYLGGNAWLMAPEISAAVPGPEVAVDFSRSDLWAVGALAYEIFGADNPFYPGKDNSHRQLEARNYREEDLPPLPDDVPTAVKKLVQSLLLRDPHKRPRPSVAVAVAQLAALSLSAEEASPLHRKVPFPDASQGQGKLTVGEDLEGQSHLDETGARRTRRHGLCTESKVTVAPIASFHNRSNLKRKWLNWILALGLGLVCRLTFGKQSEPWNMESVMTFLFLSRLTYADFQQAMSYF
ncbi:hypothetical protein EGW08_000510 [Elysia chlorotica]|uniref:non-specific serine/threonine protein kinase n=1 Tax=Elysia chlorotica TaxID=188477 RepID=A0A433UD36_ELYCH|nr:hypothetical protein EGW08_000510 [Elysia chlorotica]